MKTKYIKSLLICALGFLPLVTNAQDVAIDAEIRPRTEYRDGFTKPLLTTNDPGVFTTQRTRINMSFTSGLLTTLITLQDARTFGQAALASDVATTTVYEAWADMLLVPGGSFKIGRQALNYDDKRLFSSPTWSNTGTAHDMALIKYNINDFQAHVGIAYNNNAAISAESYYNPLVKYRYLNYLWLSKDIYKGLSISAIGVDEGVQDTMVVKPKKYSKTGMNHAYTYGGNLKFQNDSCPFSALATAYFQAGESGTGLEMSGKLLAVKMDYQIMKSVSVGIGTDYLSGDNKSTDKQQTNFKKLYGADHTFNGIMDYWDTPLTQGLLDYYGSATAKIGKKLSIEGAFHWFNAEMSGKNKKGVAFGKDLGSEIDLMVTYKLNTWTSIQAGWSTYLANQNTLIAKDIVTTQASTPTTRSPQWAYLMFTVKIPPTTKGM